MNILIPDSWLREYLETNAKPVDLQRCLSRCGPSVERINEAQGESIYDIEVTTNRIDNYSVYGIAREASVILPRFGYQAKLLPLPYYKLENAGKPELDIDIVDKKGYCRRILAIKIENITLGPSPKWIQDKLERVGQRPLNNIIDITNFVMWEMGHPCHAFDYDRLRKKTIIAQEAKKGQVAVTLDNKHHVMRGGELIFDDGTGEIIDIPGIMGTANTVVTDDTKNVLLFIENSDPAHIRHTSMELGIRTQAATINEKNPDPELALTAMNRSVELATKITQGSVGSKLYDQYPKPYKSYIVSVSRQRVDGYLGFSLKDIDIGNILTSLGFSTRIDKINIEVTVPSWRRDITIDVDIIEEIARIYGYHRIANRLPDTEPPLTLPDETLSWEEDIKIRLRDWGYTEVLTYSMISEAQMEAFGLDKQKTYKITNPLTNEWVYMRTTLQPSFLATMKENLKIRSDVRLFELSKVYHYRDHDLPDEEDMLIVGLSGDTYFHAKGLGEAILALFGVTGLSNYGSVSKREGMTILELSLTKLIRDANPVKTYVPIPKYPPLVEDLSFTVPDRFEVGPFMQMLKSSHRYVTDVTILDVHENSRTFHIIYQDPEKNLSNEEIAPVREALITLAKSEFGAILKSS